MCVWALNLYATGPKSAQQGTYSIRNCSLCEVSAPAININQLQLITIKQISRRKSCANRVAACVIKVIWNLHKLDKD